MPSAVSGRQWPAESPQKKTPVLGAAPELVRDPVALVADRVALEVVGKEHRRVLHVEARVERADADPGLLARGERPAVAGGHVAAVDPDLEIVAGPGRVDLEAARERRIGRLVAAGGETRRHPSASTTSGAETLAAVRADDARGARPRPSTFAVSNSASQPSNRIWHSVR